MTFLQGIIWYAIKFVFLLAVAVGGVICGKKLKDSRTKHRKNNIKE